MKTKKPPGGKRGKKQGERGGVAVERRGGVGAGEEGIQGSCLRVVLPRFGCISALVGGGTLRESVVGGRCLNPQYTPTGLFHSLRAHAAAGLSVGSHSICTQSLLLCRIQSDSL